ncbi:restriction endonuclease [Halobacteria archaeon AArc-dxtr1]|nr:restriction endonuclease [Halobacteria archaeon AArc-dxtr1]
MTEAALLDDLSGFEFEDVMEDVFRKLGYENVRQAERTADMGRDIVMEEVVDGTHRAVVVECKHTDAVSRPVVQKLHSAVATYDFDGPKRGIVATTGRFTAPAREYAADLRAAGDPHPIELVDGTDLRELADEVGLDLYNGRIEIICEETLRPLDPTGSVADPVREAFRGVENLDAAVELPSPRSSVAFEPVVTITAEVDAVFETAVGVVHRVDETETVAVRAVRGQPAVLRGPVRRLVSEHRHRTTDLDESRFAEIFDDVAVTRFGRTETEYKEWAVDRFRERHTATVSYTGDNNVTYTKTCEPRQSDVSVQSITPVYVPRVRQAVEVGEYRYPYAYYAAGPSRVTTEDGIRRCVHCGTDDSDATYTYCDNCGSINCADHIRTERLESEPVCTGCAVTERFALKTKYFYDEDNREAFQAEYEAMALHEKVRENPALLAGLVAFGLVVLVGILSSVGVV